MLFGKHINKYYKKYWYLFLIGIVTLIAIDYAQTILPEALGEIVTLFQHGGGSSESQVMPIVWRVVIVALVLAAGRVIWRVSIFSASSRIEMGMREEMFVKSERVSQTYLHQNPVGNIMNWFSTDIESVNELLGWGTIMMVDAFFMSALVIVKMFLVNWFVSIVILVPMLLIVIWGAFVEKFMSERWRQRQKANDELYDFAQENITGLRVIKAFVKEKQQLHAFAKVAWKNREVNIKFARISVIFDVFIELIIGAVFAIALALGGYLAYRSFGGDPLFGLDLDSGQLTTIIGYFGMLIWPMMALGQVFAMRSRAKTSLERISGFLDSDEDIKDPENPVEFTNPRGEIEFRDFHFAYPDADHESIKGVSLKINAGETIGVVGKIGSAKSTLVNSLARLYNVKKGSVFIDGVDIMDAKVSSLRGMIAYVPQDNFLFSDEIRNNIAFGNVNASMEQVYAAATFASVATDIDGFTEKYSTVSGERGVTLSGGQKQRISIARAFLEDAPIMVLDDSVSAVDVKTEEEILHNIREQRKGKTTILVASRVSTVASLNKIAVMKKGVLEAFGTHEELLKTSPTYQKMVRLQELEREAEGQ
ncbi:MAG: ABC transporter ATP-binding protein/permease [Bacilli bacterium]|nr:ABC transporter ATP-binding protein/permease [Bacilli bacterium]